MCRTILIIDDDVHIRTVIQEALEMVGYTVYSAANGVEGLHSLRDNQPIDLVITDIFMDKADGIEVITQIRKNYEGTRVIAISGRQYSKYFDMLNTAASLGADKTLMKPFRLDAIIEAVDEVLGK